MTAPEEQKIEVPPMDWGMAAIQGLIKTLVVLQRNGALQISDVVNEIGNTVDFRRKHKTEEPGQHEALAQLYNILMAADENEANLAESKAKRDAARKSGGD